MEILFKKMAKSFLWQHIGHLVHITTAVWVLKLFWRLSYSL